MTDRAPSPQTFKPAAVCHPGNGVAVVFCGGFKSTMNGNKAKAFEKWCQQRSWSYCRFDYRGHGQSAGKFEDGNISLWLDDTLTVIDSIQNNKLILVGSSMGAWIAQLACLQRPERVVGLLLLASATDFTRELIENRLSKTQQQRLEEDGRILIPSEYDDGSPYPITQQLLQDGARHLLLQSAIAITCPVRLIHGTGDCDVPWQTSQKTLDRIRSRDARLLLLKDADHRLSNSAELAILESALVELYAVVSKQ